MQDPAEYEVYWEEICFADARVRAPAVALLFGGWILGENPSFESVLGSGLTLAGVYLVYLRRKNGASALGRGKA